MCYHCEPCDYSDRYDYVVMIFVTVVLFALLWVLSLLVTWLALPLVLVSIGISVSRVFEL